MIIYYDWNRSPNCLKTKILLNELGIEYAQCDVEQSDLRGADYRQKFPTGQAPAIEDGELRLCESQAIGMYLAEKHGALLPKAPHRRALMFQALSLESSLLAPTVGGAGLFGELYKPEGERNAARIAELRVKAHWVGQVLGATLGEREWFAEELSIADIQLYAATSKSLENGAFGDAPKNLVAWCARMTARPSVASARELNVHYRRAPARGATAA